MKSVIFAVQAEAELTESISFYEARSSGLGLEFEQAIERAIQEIQEAPQRFPPQKGGKRRYVLQRFPFVIYYADFPEHIWIVAIAHTSRRAGYWRGRREP